MGAAQDLAIAAIAREQHGLVTRPQLVRAGLSPRTVRRRVLAGLLIPAGARTFRVSAAPVTDHQVVLAGSLDRSGVPTHRSSAWAHGLMALGGSIDLSVLKGAPTRLAASDSRTLVIHTTTSLPPSDVVVVDGIPVATVARTLMGLAALVPHEISEEQLLDVISAAIEMRKASAGWLRWFLDQRRCRGRNGVAAFEQALDRRVQVGPTESWLERRVLEALDRAGLPRPALQRHVGRGRGRPARVDFVWEEQRVVLEALGYAFHRTPDQLSADASRANDLQLEGYTVLQVTSRMMDEDPRHLPVLVARALAPSPF